MECVILFRNPFNDKIGFMPDSDGQIAVWPDHDAAVESIESFQPPKKKDWVYQIVELDEL